MNKNKRRRSYLRKYTKSSEKTMKVRVLENGLLNSVPAISTKSTDMKQN